LGSVLHLTFIAAYAEALSNRGNTLHGLKRFEEAMASYDRALKLQPDYAEALLLMQRRSYPGAAPYPISIGIAHCSAAAGVRDAT
jgi:tetratricopeptide (TPR) repeat protein